MVWGDRSEWVSGGLTPCRQLRPSSRREHVSASNSHVMSCEGLSKRKPKIIIGWVRRVSVPEGCCLASPWKSGSWRRGYLIRSSEWVSEWVRFCQMPGIHLCTAQMDPLVMSLPTLLACVAAASHYKSTGWARRWCHAWVPVSIPGRVVTFGDLSGTTGRGLPFL